MAIVVGVCAVTKPLPFVVMAQTAEADPQEPGAEFTVARVVASEPPGVVISPVSMGNCPAVTVDSLPSADPVEVTIPAAGIPCEAKAPTAPPSISDQLLALLENSARWPEVGGEATLNPAKNSSTPLAQPCQFRLVLSYPSSPLAAETYPAATGSLTCVAPLK